jgi:hypothetical protein
MKKTMISMLVLLLLYYSNFAQTRNTPAPLQQTVSRLDKATTVKDYELLEKEFAAMAAASRDWLPYYYAAFCNAKIGFLYQDDGERIEPYSKQGEEQALKSQSLLDSTTQKNELSELYTVMSMVYRTKVFINPMTYGRKYGLLSQHFLDMAKALSPHNPRVLYVEAWVKYNTPKMWGGDKNLAKQLANESLAQLQQASDDVQPHWGKTENMTLLNQYK